MVRQKTITASGLGALSKGQLRSKKAFHKRLGKPAAAPKAQAEVNLEETKTKKVGGSKNGGERIIPVHKAGKYYPAQDTPIPKKSRKAAPATATLKKSIQPGSVLILLAGKYRGKRVVFLKQLKSGLLLVTGPYKINGVPLRRVNQAYTIATSTTVDLAGLKVDDKFDDAYFKKTSTSSSKASEAKFFQDKAEPTEADKEKKAAKAADQKTIDASILASIKQTPHLSAYLAAPFALSKGQYPHLLKF